MKSKAAIGVVGLLAIASGTLVTASPSWAVDMTVSNQVGKNITLTNLYANCSPQGCAQEGSNNFATGGSVTFNVVGYMTASGVPSGGWASVGATFKFYSGSTPKTQILYFSAVGSTPSTSGTSSSPSHWLYTAPQMGCEMSHTGPLKAYPNYDGNFTCAVAPSAHGPRGDVRATRTADTRIANNWAFVKNGKANVRIGPMAYNKFRLTERVVLRDSRGRVLGKVDAKMTTGRPDYVKVPLPQRIRKKLRDGNHLAVSAQVKHADATKGTGHKIKRLNLAMKPPKLPERSVQNSR